MRSIMFVALALLTLTANAASHFTFSNQPGPYAVGLHVVPQLDHARAFKEKIDLVTGQPSQRDAARPVQTLVWYPALPGGTPVHYLDYMRTAVSEDAVDMTDAQIGKALDARLAEMNEQWGAEQVKQEINQPMWAVKDAKAKEGKFPVVIYAASFSSNAAENVDLCEFLASHGYVVIAVPSMGAHSHSMTKNIEGIEAQVGDIEFAISYAHTLPQADTSHIAVAGYSWGGISNVFAAAKDNRITALVALDGSVRYWPMYVDGGKDAAKYVSAAKLTVPLLFLGQPLSIEEFARINQAQNWSFLNAMKYADVYNVTMQPMKHIDFSSHFIRFEKDVTSRDYSLEEVSAAHSWMARYVEQFLNAYLKNDAAGLAFMNNAPEKNGVPAHVVFTNVHHAEAAPPNRGSFAAELAKRGFDHATDIYQDFHKKTPEFQLSPDEVNNWGYALLGMGKGKEAIDLFLLGTVIDPDNMNAYDSLAEGYERNGDKALAIKNYQYSLKLDPKNTHAVERLKILGVNMAAK